MFAHIQTLGLLGTAGLLVGGGGTAAVLRMRSRRASTPHHDPQALVDACATPAWVFDPETLQFLAVNDLAVQRYGWSHEEFLELTLRDLRLPEDLIALQLGLARDRRTPTGHHLNRHRYRDGTVVDVMIDVRPVQLRNGREGRFVIVTGPGEPDVVATALRDCSAVLESVLVLAAEPLAITDDEGRIVHVNGLAAGVLGNPVHNLLGVELAAALPDTMRSISQPVAAEDGTPLVHVHVLRPRLSSVPSV